MADQEISGAGAVQLLSAWPSPFSMRAELALAFKGVEFEKLPQDLSNKSQLLLHSNPIYKKVPVLLHHGKPICESTVIVQYVEDAWPHSPNLLPPNPYHRAIARFWADYVDKKVFDVLLGILKTKGDEQKVAIENAMAVMATLEEALGSVPQKEAGPFFGGATVGFVDIIAGPFLVVWLPAVETIGKFSFPFEEKCPRLQAWLSAFKDHPLHSILPEVSKITEFAQNVLMKRFQ